MSGDFEESPPSKANAPLRSTGQISFKRSVNNFEKDPANAVNHVGVEFLDDSYLEPDVKKSRGDKSFSLNVGGSDASSVNLSDVLESCNTIMFPEYKEVKYTSTDSDSTSKSNYSEGILGEQGETKQIISQCLVNANKSSNKSPTRLKKPPECKDNNTNGKMSCDVRKIPFGETHFNEFNETNGDYEVRNSIAEQQALPTSASWIDETTIQVNSQLNTKPTGSQTVKKRGRPPKIPLDESKRLPGESDKKLRSRLADHRYKARINEKLSIERKSINMAIERMKKFKGIKDQANYLYLQKKLCYHNSKHAKNREWTAPTTRLHCQDDDDRKNRWLESRRKSSAKSRAIDAEEQTLFKEIVKWIGDELASNKSTLSIPLRTLFVEVLEILKSASNTST